jgi:hypothetical protein
MSIYREPPLGTVANRLEMIILHSRAAFGCVPKLQVKLQEPVDETILGSRRTS